MSTIRRAVLIAVGLSLAQPAFAAAKKKRETPADQAGKGKQAVDPKLIDAVANARYMFIRRVDMCAPPQRCDTETMTVVDDAEKRFVTSCLACAADKKCEEDRAQIRDGKAPRTFNPCE